MYEKIDFDIFDKYIIAEMADEEKGIDPWSFHSETVNHHYQLYFGCSYDEAQEKGISDEEQTYAFFGVNEDITIFIMDNADLIESNSKYDEYMKKCWSKSWRCWEG